MSCVYECRWFDFTWYVNFFVNFTTTTINLHTGVVKSNLLSKGDPYRLLRGVDYQGQICGIDQSVKNFANIWKPNLFGTNFDTLGILVPPDFGICVASCPVIGNSVRDVHGKGSPEATLIVFDGFVFLGPPVQMVGLYGNWTAQESNVDIFYHCIPASLEKAQNYAVTVMGDFVRVAGPIAAIGFVVSVGASILFLVTIRIPCVLRTVVWTCILLVQCLFTAGGYILLQKAQQRRSTAFDWSGTDIEVSCCFVSYY